MLLPTSLREQQIRQERQEEREHDEDVQDDVSDDQPQDQGGEEGAQDDDVQQQEQLAQTDGSLPADIVPGGGDIEDVRGRGY